MKAPTLEQAMFFMHDAQVHHRVDLSGPWEGWRVRGRDLVSPDRQRITPERLQGLLWRDAMELRLAGFASRRRAEADKRNAQRVKVVVVQLGDYLDGQKVSAA